MGGGTDVAKKKKQTQLGTYPKQIAKTYMATGDPFHFSSDSITVLSIF